MVIKKPLPPKSNEPEDHDFSKVRIGEGGEGRRKTKDNFGGVGGGGGGGGGVGGGGGGGVGGGGGGAKATEEKKKIVSSG